MVATMAKGRQESLSEYEELAALSTDQVLPLSQVPTIVHQAISRLFSTSGTDYLRIFEHLLRYAVVRQQSLEEGGDVAVISIPSQWKLYKSDTTWPCCYATLNTFIRLLCALGIFYKHCYQKGQGAEYHLPLNLVSLRPDAFTALDRLIDPSQTKNPKVRRLAASVKVRLTLFSGVQSQTAAFLPTPVDSALQTALDAVKGLVHPLTGLNGNEKQHFLIQISKILVQLHTTGSRQSEGSLPAVDSRSPCPLSDTSITDIPKKVRDTAVDSSAVLVDSRLVQQSDEPAKRGDSLLTVDSLASHLSLPLNSESEESTARTCATAYYNDENLRLLKGDRKNRVDFGIVSAENLLAGVDTVDSGDHNDNDSNTCNNPFKEKDTVIDDVATTKSKQQQSMYRPLDARSAQSLAIFIEGHAGNFRSYIALSTKYHPQIMRAAVLNMLAHSFFPDLTGELSGDVDGELTGKVGRPKKPGAWVTACCQAYAQHGIPQVMRLLLQTYSEPYEVVRRQLENRSRELTPVHFWGTWQEQLLLTQTSSERQLSSSPPVDPAYGTDHPGVLTVYSRMMSTDAQQLVTQINTEGRAFHMQARPRLQDGRWEVEVEMQVEGRSSCYTFHSKDEWDTYYAEICELSH